MAKETINEKWACSKRNLVTKYWSQSLPLPFTVRLPSFIFYKMANAGHWMRTMQTTDHNWILLNMSYLFKWHWYSRWRVYLILFTEIFFWYEQLCMYDLKNIHIPLLSNHQSKSKWQPWSIYYYFKTNRTQFQCTLIPLLLTSFCKSKSPDQEQSSLP